MRKQQQTEEQKMKSEFPTLMPICQTRQKKKSVALHFLGKFKFPIYLLKIQHYKNIRLGGDDLELFGGLQANESEVAEKGSSTLGNTKNPDERTDYI